VDAATSGRYQGVELLGRGGMGAVYRVHDSVRGHIVALKRLFIDEETKHREERIALFHREYRTLAELNHPRVIGVYDYGIDAEGPYYTMELLNGSDLSGKAPRWRAMSARLWRYCIHVATCIAMCRRSTCVAPKMVAPS
jgi:serine/threonine protein kinase